LSFEIVPQAISMFPEDQQYLTARATYPPIIWGNTLSGGSTLIGGGRIQSALGGQGLLAQSLRQGTGSVKWVLGTNMIPSTGATLEFRLTSGVQFMKVSIGPTTTNVQNEAALLLASFAYAPAPGDIIRLEVSGNTLKLYVKLLLRTFYVALAAIKYPFFAQVNWTLPFTTTPIIIEPPSLAGDWIGEKDLLVSGNWSSTPSTAPGGTFDDATNNGGTTYTAGNAPGVYYITNTAAAQASQVATSVITIEPLTIFGESTLNVLSSAKVQLQTNYDRAQKKLVTWSILSGGGTLSGTEFTAPATAGTSVLRAAYSFQHAEISVVVKPTITADKIAAEPGEVVNFTTNIGGSITWSADIGTPTSGSGAAFAWAAPGIAQTEAIIKATNGTLTVSLVVPVLKKFPYDPTLSVPWTQRKTVLISRAEDRTRSSRVKDKDGLAYESFELKFANRDLTEINAALAFWQEHYPQKRFIYMDKIRNIRSVQYFDSDVNIEGDVTCSMDYAFRTIGG
jgi:hypothetical protein